MQISEVMTRQVITVRPDIAVRDIINVMKQYHITTVPVVEGDQLVGIVSESDLLMKETPVHVPAYISFLDSIIPLQSLQHLEEELRKLVGSQARHVMTSPVETVGETDTTTTAAALMTEKKLLSLPVVDARGKLIGIVSQGDIVRSLAR